MHGHVGVYLHQNKRMVPFFDSRRGAVLNMTQDGLINVDCINLKIYVKWV